MHSLIHSKIISRLGFRRAIESLAIDIDYLCPIEVSEVSAAIYFPSDIDRVTGVGYGTSMENEIARISARRVEHAATIKYRFSDVALVDGYLLARGAHVRIDPGKFPWLFRGESSFREKGALAATWTGLRFFGDWLPDDILRMLTLESVSPLVSPQKNPWFHQDAYLSCLGINLERFRRCVFNEFYMLDDRGQNSYKKKRYAILRNRLLSPLNLHNSRVGGVFLIRGESGAKRVLVNEREVAEVLESIGIQPIDTAQLPVEKIIRACAGAEWVIGVEGSQISHAFVVMAPGAKVIALQPPFQFNNVYKDRCDCVGSRYGFLVGERAGAGFSVNTGKLLSLIEEMDSVA